MTYNPVPDFDVGSQQCGPCLREIDASHWKEAIQWFRGHKPALKAVGERARCNIGKHFDLRCFRERLKTKFKTYYASR
jgi:hypothetical protein